MSRTKLKLLPSDYTPGVIRRLDRRTQLGQRIYDHFSAIIADLGGFRVVSHTKIALVERFVFMIAVMEQHEDAMLRDRKVSEEQGAKFTQMANAIVGLSRLIGLEKSKTAVGDLETYLKKRA